MEIPIIEASSKDSDVDNDTIDINKFTKSKIIKNVFLVSFTFLLGGTASDGLNFFQSTMNKEVGVISFSVHHACGCISAIFLPKYLIRRFGSKLVMVVSTFALVPYIASNYYPVFGFMIPTTIFAGFASCLVFNSLATYLNDLATIYTELCLKDENQNESVNSTNPIKEISNSKRMKSSDDIFEHCTFDKRIKGMVENESASIKFECCTQYKKSILKENTEKSSLIEEGQKGAIKEIQTVLNDKYGSIKNQTMPDYSNSENQNHHSKAFKLEKIHGKKRIIQPRVSLSSIDEMSLEPENEVKTEIIVENAQVDLTSQTPSDKAIKVLETTTSRFFGIFGCIYQLCHILCTLISHFIFKNTSEVRDYTHNSTCFCGSDFCSMESSCFLHDLQLPSNETRYTLTSVFITISILSGLLTLLFLDELGENSDKLSFTFDVAIMVTKLHKNRNLLLLVPLSIYIGMAQAFMMGDFTKDFIGCAWGVEHVSLVMLSAGCTISLFSGLYALLEKHMGRIVFFLIAAAMNLAVNVTMLCWIPDAAYPAMMFIVSGIWGAIIGILWCQLRAFIGILFKEEEETAFGCYQLWHGLGAAVVYAYNNYVCTYIKIYIMLTVSTIAAIGYLLAERNYSLSKKKSNAL